MKQRKTTPAFIRNRLPAAVIILAAALLSVSCVNPLEKIGGSEEEIAVLSEGRIALTVCIGGVSRSAFPLDFSGLDWTVTATKEGDNPQEPVEAVSKTESASGVFVCGFYYKGPGNYTITLDGYTKNDPAEKVYTGSATVGITGSTVNNVAVTVTATDTTVPGDISLNLDAEGSAVTGFSVQCTSDTESLDEKPINSASGTVEHIGVTPGVYTMTINALNSAGELVYVCIEKVTVCPGLTTGTWVMPDGTTSDTLTITDAMLFSTFFVAGEGGTFYSTVNDKTCTYGEEREGNDKSETGSIDAPFATVSRAIKKCTVPDKAYIVCVDGTVTESASIEIPKGVKVTVKSLAGSTSGSDIAPTATIKAASGTTNMITIATDAKLTMTDITLEGQSIGRGINVTGGECTLTNCIITGQKTSGSGAGIYIDGGKVTLNKTQITNCTATGNGGGVYVNAGTFAMSGTAEISNNTANFGGGVYSSGTFEMKAGTISGNEANYGGGVYVIDGTFDMSAGTISNNTAKFGGGVWTKVGLSLSSKDAVITGNTARNNGGGVYVNAGTFEMSAGTISNNTAENSFGGGVQLGSGSHTMSGGTISGNTAGNGTSSGLGGGVYSSGTFEMKAGTISGNSVALNGGGVYSSGTFTMFGTAAISGNKAKSGGGVYSSGTFTMFGTAAISGNTATSGGGIYVVNGGEFTMTAGTVSGNNSTANGGGVWTNGTFEMKGGTIGGSNSYNAEAALADKTDMGNTAANGGGVYVSGNGTFEMSSTAAISGNTAKSGGGVYSAGTSNTINAGTISGNTAETYGGGGVYVSAGTFEMKAGTISGNTAKTSGGGVFKTGTGTFTMTGGTIGGSNSYNAEAALADKTDMGNSAALNGGGVYVDAGTFTMNAGAAIACNEAAGNDSTFGQGGGVYVNAGTFTMNAGAITANMATRGTSTSSHSGYGGGVCVKGGTFTMTGGTIGGNSAYSAGGGVYAGSNSTFTMTGGTIGGSDVYDDTASTDDKKDMGNKVSGSAGTTGGGVYVVSSEFTMSGTAKISRNTAVHGGGVFSSGAFTMKGGQISSNTASVAGGGVNVRSDTFTMEAGTISGNSVTGSSSKGGGVCLSDSGDATFEMTGGTISYNNATFAGGGVCMNEDGSCTFKMSGAPKITGNTVGGSTTNNVYLPVDLTKKIFSTITITGVLTNTDGESVGITLSTVIPSYLYPITSGFKSSGNMDTASPFFSDNTTFWQRGWSGGEIYLQGL